MLHSQSVEAVNFTHAVHLDRPFRPLQMNSHSNGHSNEQTTELPFLDLWYTNDESETSAKELVYQVRPVWQQCPEQVDIVKFTEGITNTLFKLSRRTPGLTQDEVDEDAVLMRAYGNNTEILIDRDREAMSHQLCADKNLAPPLLARFNNGLLYSYVPGQVCTPQDLIQENVWRLVASKLGEWHSRLPIELRPAKRTLSNGATNGVRNGISNGHYSATTMSSRTSIPNIWSVMQRWIKALPVTTTKQQARRDLLQRELERSFRDLDNDQGPGRHGMVFGHCDLLCGNVIRLPSRPGRKQAVGFIDYEYAVPCPAAFDIANHFAEWGGFDCDFTMLPTISVRRKFLEEYLSSYNAHNEDPLPDTILVFLEQEIDRYRGMPGLYWGIWALIQSVISQIDFDYASYAEIRLGEYFAWRAEEDGTRKKEGKEMPLRERVWSSP